MNIKKEKVVTSSEHTCPTHVALYFFFSYSARWYIHRMFYIKAMNYKVIKAGEKLAEIICCGW